jgi:hypothetical protein
MKPKVLVFIALSMILFSCDFRKSINKDLITGLFTKGNGLSSEDVYLTNGEEKIKGNSFPYGEKVIVRFETIEGFKKENDRVFPGLRLFVIDQAGDTILKYDDLYAEMAEGTDISPLVLYASLVVAKPIHSGNKYSLNVNIWDKKGKGTFTAKLDFDVVPNKEIKIESKNITYDEIYLFSQERDAMILKNEVKFNENIYMLFDGLSGFTEEGGKVLIGLSMRLTDAEGTLILNEEDMMGNDGLSASDLKTQLAPNFIFSGSVIKNPVTCEINVWDKKSDNKIKASVKLNVK